MKPELRPSLDEILNHPFLRNGGPPKRFSTAHGLRGSSSSSSTAAAATASAAAGTTQVAAVAIAPGRTVLQKHTPERCAGGGSAGAGGGLAGRPPLKTRSVNVEVEGGQVDGGGGGARAIGGGKTRAGSGVTGR